MNHENDKRISNQFYKFCTRLLKNEIYDICRKQNKGRKYKKGILFLPLDDIKQIGVCDDYFDGENRFYIDGETVTITDNRIASAISTLSKNKQDIIILAYFMGMNDREIGECLNLIQQTVYYQRIQALKLLREQLHKEGFDYERKNY